MITIEEFHKMKPGTIFYVAAPGRPGLEANYISEECFQEIVDSSIPGNPHISTDGGHSISFHYGKNGDSFYHTLEEAQEFMTKRHIRFHKQRIMKRAAMIESLKKEISDMETFGPGEPNFIFHKRGKV